MSETTIDWRLFGEQLRRVLAEQHDVRVDQRLLHERLTGIEKTLGGLIEMFGQFSKAFGTTSGRIDALGERVGQASRDFAATNGRIDALGERMDQRFDRLEAAVAASRPADGDSPTPS